MSEKSSRVKNLPGSLMVKKTTRMTSASSVQVSLATDSRCHARWPRLRGCSGRRAGGVDWPDPA